MNEKLTTKQCEWLLQWLEQWIGQVHNKHDYSYVVERANEFLNANTDNTCPVCGSGCCFNELHDMILQARRNRKEPA